eukprot:4907781-Pleurochrysis_carterae.AAC.1
MVSAWPLEKECANTCLHEMLRGAAAPIESAKQLMCNQSITFCVSSSGSVPKTLRQTPSSSSSNVGMAAASSPSCHARAMRSAA